MTTRNPGPGPADETIVEPQLIQPAVKRVRWRQWLPWLAVLAVAAMFIYRAGLRPAPVKMHTVVTGDVRVEVLGTGTLEARVKTTISPRIQERLAMVFVDQGDAVRSGQLLARLDDAELRQQVAIAEAALAAAHATVERVRADEARARAVLQKAQLDHKRVTDLIATRVASQSDFDKAVETLRVAEAEMNRSQAVIKESQSQAFTAEKNLLYRQEQLAFTEIRSPYDGLITRRDRDPGGVVVPGSSLLQLVGTNDIWISAWVDETAMSALATNQPARVIFRSEPAKSHAGDLARLGREADRETREFLVDVRVKQLPSNWTMGQRAEVYIETGRRTGVVTVPAQFLIWKEGRPGVFVNERGRARWREVTPGLRGMQEIEVIQGLIAGEQIAKPSGGQNQPLTGGQRIRKQ